MFIVGRQFMTGCTGCCYSNHWLYYIPKPLEINWSPSLLTLRWWSLNTRSCWIRISPMFPRMESMWLSLLENPWGPVWVLWHRWITQTSNTVCMLNLRNSNSVSILINTKTVILKVYFVLVSVWQKDKWLAHIGHSYRYKRSSRSCTKVVMASGNARV